MKWRLFLLAIIFPGFINFSLAQTAEATLSWLNEYKVNFNRGSEVYNFDFTSEYLLYKGSTRDGQKMDTRLVKYNWEDITGIKIIAAHVTIELRIEGKGYDLTKEEMKPSCYLGSFTISDYYPKIDIEELEQALKHMAMLKGAQIKN